RVDVWAVRLPAALAALGLVLLVYWLCARRGRPVAGLVAALVLATSLHFTWLARVGRIDMPLTLTIALALTGLYLGDQRRKEGSRRAWRWFLLAYVAVAAGLLLKGPIAAVLPSAVAIVYLLIERSRHLVTPSPCHPVTLSRGYGLWWGVPLVLALTAP